MQMQQMLIWNKSRCRPGHLEYEGGEGKSGDRKEIKQGEKRGRGAQKKVEQVKVELEERAEQRAGGVLTSQ